MSRSVWDILFGDEPTPNEERLAKFEHLCAQVDAMAVSQITMWAVLTRIEAMVMATNWDSFNEALSDVLEGYAAQAAKIRVLEEALKDQDRKTQDAVNKALDDDNQADQAKIDAADARIREGITPPESTGTDENGATPDVNPNSSEAPDHVQANTGE